MRPRLAAAAPAPAPERRRSSYFELVGACEPMQRLYDLIEKIADDSSAVMISGEGGTGKDLVAHAITRAGSRRNRPFIKVDCATLPESSIEAELFGYDKASFMDTRGSHPGSIEAAEGGTLFLDEISCLNLSLQGKLLRVLEDRAVQRTGGKVARRIDFRLITANTGDLEPTVRAGRFRNDLYCRINIVPIPLPALRERQGDIPLLVEHFLRLYCERNKLAQKRVAPEVIQALEEHTWPGNVREIETTVRRMVLLSDGPLLTVGDLPLPFYSRMAARQLMIPDEGIDFPEEIARVEMAYIQAALRRAKGKKVAAAALLRLNRQQLKYLCRKYRIL